MGNPVMASDSSERGLAYLTTSGRISGSAHQIEIWFAMGEGTAYFLAGDGDRSDWVRNIMVSPDVVLEIGGRKRSTRARVVAAGSEEDATARELVVGKYTARGEANLSDWGRRALAVAVDWPD